MSFTITCPSCGLQGDAPDSLAVDEVKCPRCGTAVPVRRRERAAALVGAGVAAVDSRMHAIDQFFLGDAPPPARSPRRSGLRTSPLHAAEEDTVYEVAVSPEEKAAEQQWAKEERARIEAYAAKQFAQIKQQREELAAWRSQVEAALVAREQEVNRQAKVLAARGETLQKREAECARREAALAHEEEQVSQARADRDRLVQQQHDAEATLAAHRAALAQVEAQRTEAGEALRRAEADLQRVVDEMADYNRARDDEEREWNVRRKELDRRLQALEQHEQAVARQLMEAAEVESLVRSELDRRGSELAALSRELDDRHKALLVGESADLRRLRAKVAAVSAKLDEERRKGTAWGAERRNLHAKIVLLSRHVEACRRPRA